MAVKAYCVSDGTSFGNSIVYAESAGQARAAVVRSMVDCGYAANWRDGLRKLTTLRAPWFDVAIGRHGLKVRRPYAQAWLDSMLGK